jgi:hypothetical protein
MPIEVKSIAFGMSRYSTRCWHLDGATWAERRAAEAVKERDAAAAAIDAEVFAGVVPPPPMQTQIQRMGGMSSAVIGGFCEHRQPRRPRASGQVRRHDRQGHGKAEHEWQVAAQRGHA